MPSDLSLRIDDVAIDALAMAVQTGVAYLDDGERHYTANAWATFLKHKRIRARAALSDGSIAKAVADIRPSQYAEHLAVLAMLPGGIRLFGVVFCARHYPAGTDARFRLSCPQCSPDDYVVREPRDVVTIEGEI